MKAKIVWSLVGAIALVSLLLFVFYFLNIPLGDKSDSVTDSVDGNIRTPGAAKVEPLIDKDQARLKVENRVEVQKYKFDLVKLGSEAQVEIEDLGDEWNVHVFEIVKQGDSSHTATFGWYRVDKKTGKVEKDI